MVFADQRNGDANSSVIAAKADFARVVRLLDLPDLPWLHDLFGRRYPTYDALTTERWFRAIVTRDALNMFAARTDDAFLVALVAVLPWLPGEPEVNVVCICAEEDRTWEVMALLRASIDWARKRNAARWRINTETEYSIAPLALRVGAREITPRYQIDLRGS